MTGEAQGGVDPEPVPLRRRDLLGLGAGSGAIGALAAAATTYGLERHSSTGEGTVHVRDQGVRGDGRSDDTRALQAVIDRAGGQVVRFGSGTYLVSQLLLPDGAHLDLGNAVLRRYRNTVGASGGATLRNADPDNGNADITVIGGTIEGGSGTRGRLLSFVNTARLDVRGTTLRKGRSDFVDWMFHIAGCEDVHIADARIHGGLEIGEDGLHITASRRVTVANCTIDSGDDALAIVQEYRQQQPTRDVAVVNCVLRSQQAHMIRISVYPQETQGIDGVVLSNLIGVAPPGGSSGTPVLVNDDSGRDLVRRLGVDNVVIDARGSTGDAWHVSGVRGASFRGVRVVGADAHGFLIETSRNLQFTDCHAESPRPSNGNSAWTLSNCQHVSVVQCSAGDAAVHGFEVTGQAAAEHQFIGCVASGSGAYGFHLEAVDGVLLCGCATSGGVEGVNCATDRPPSGLRVIACRFSGQADRAVKTPPPAAFILGNTDTPTSAVEQRLPGPIGFFGAEPVQRPSVSGSRGGNEALAAIVVALSGLGLITDDTTE